jgi:hypothetical protein
MRSWKNRKKDGISATLTCFTKIAHSQEHPSSKIVAQGAINWFSSCKDRVIAAKNTKSAPMICAKRRHPACLNGLAAV